MARVVGDGLAVVGSNRFLAFRSSNNPDSPFQKPGDGPYREVTAIKTFKIIIGWSIVVVVFLPYVVVVIGKNMGGWAFNNTSRFVSWTDAVANEWDD